MPIFYQQDIDESTRLAVWQIEENEDFFDVPLSRNIHHPNKRLQHLAGRYLLRYLFTDFPLDLIEIADTRKPFLKDEAYHFSISHCSRFAAAIVSKHRRVGIDIEVPTPKVEKISHKFLHPQELKFVEENRSADLGESGGADDFLLLTLLWSMKESVFKWWSYGDVEFAEMIRLQAFALQPKGFADVIFKAPEATVALELQYRIFPHLVLTWTIR